MGRKVKTPLDILPPKRFVGIHAHDCSSSFDGLGYPNEHMDFVLENGMDALAVTNHGNANSHAHVKKHWDVLKKKGRKFRSLYGVEFYFVPSLTEWRRDKERYQTEQRLERSKVEEEPEVIIDDDGKEEADRKSVV